MTQSKTTFDYHDLGKQKQIIRAFKNDLKKLEEEQINLENELKDFQKGQETDEEYLARVKEFNGLIQQNKNELEKLDGKLTELECQRQQLEHDLDVQQQQKPEENRNELEEELEHFEYEKSYLKDQREILEDEKSQLERIINHLNERNQQLETELNKLPLEIEKLHDEIGLIDQKLRNTDEDVQSKENEILNLQKNEQTITSLQQENDRFNAELIRMDHLINRISLIIAMKQNNNPKEFTQFKKNLAADLQQAQKDLAEIQRQTHSIIEIEQSIQPLEHKLDKLVKELTEYENDLRISNKSIDQRKQRITLKEKELNQLKGQKIDTDGELTLKEQEQIEVKDRIEDLDQEQNNLGTELESISNRLKNVQTNRNNSAGQLNNKKQIIQGLQSKLRIGKEKRTKAEQELRKQEQVFQNAQQQLQKCRQKETQCYLDEQKTRFEVETAEQNVKLVQESFDAAKKTLEALENYIKANPKAKVEGQNTKQNIVDKCRKALEASKIDLKNRNDLLKKRTTDFNEAKGNTKKAEDILEEAQKEFRTRDSNVATAHQQVSLIEQNIFEQIKDMDNTLKQHHDVEEEYKQIEERVRDQKKEIKSVEQELSIERQKLDFILGKLKDLKDKQTYVIANIEQVEKDLLEEEKALTEHQMIIDKMENNRTEQIRLKRVIEQNRIETQSISLQREESYIKGRIDTFQQLLSMIDKNIGDLQSELDQQKIRYNQIIKDQSKSEKDLQSWEKKKEDSDRRMEQYENERRQLKRDLTVKYRDLIEKKLEYQRLKYDFDQYQNELKLNQRECCQLNQRKSSVIDCLDKNQRETKRNEIKIDETTTKIQRQNEIDQKIKTALEDGNRKKEEKIYRIQRLTEQISDLSQQYNHGKHQQNEYLNSLKSIQDMKMNSTNKSINYEQELFNRRSKLNLLNHAIASKWDDIRNYKEKQNRYTFDLYSEPPEEEKK